MNPKDTRYEDVNWIKKAQD